MGNCNSGKRRRRRRRNRPGVQKLREEPDTHADRLGDLHEYDQMTTPLNPSKPHSPMGKEFRVKLAGNEDGGFTVNKDSLMITDIQNPNLKMLPQGSIIREVDGVPIFNWTQFCRNIKGKRKYALLVILPETIGVFEILPAVPDRCILVHPESLTVNTNIEHFPLDLQVVRCVDGVPVLNYAQYTHMTKGRSRFFITVADATDESQSQAFLSAASIAEFLHNSAFSEQDLIAVRNTVDQALGEVNAELYFRAREVEPRMLEQEQVAEQPDHHVEVKQSHKPTENRRTKGRKKKKRRTKRRR